MLPSNCVFTVVKKSSTNNSKWNYKTVSQPDINIYPSTGIYKNYGTGKETYGADQSAYGSRKRKLISERHYEIEEFLREEEMEFLDPSILVTIPEGEYAARKRVRLSHLSEDDKMLRRKVMNRMAAQQARDRKKVRMDYLEDIVVKLETEKKYLACENQDLHQKLEDMESKYNQLLKRISTNERHSQLASARKSSRSASGSAVSFFPLQQGRPSVDLLMLAQLLLAFLMSTSLTSSTLKKIQSTPSLKRLVYLSLVSNLKSKMRHPSLPLLKKLWHHRQLLLHHRKVI